MGILEKISEIEREIARTQKNKGVCILLVHMMWLILLLHLLSYRIPFGHSKSEACQIPGSTS